jgi:hypothetical protein
MSTSELSRNIAKSENPYELCIEINNLSKVQNAISEIVTVDSNKNQVTLEPPKLKLIRIGRKCILNHNFEFRHMNAWPASISIHGEFPQLAGVLFWRTTRCDT